MAVMSPTILVVVGAIAIIAAYFIKRLSQAPLPPGPAGIPLLGNVNDLPKPGELEYMHWLKHKDLYGPISSITVLGQTFVFINDAQIALELLTNRSGLHSARPHFHFASSMIGWKNFIAFAGYTDTFKLHRKNFAKVAGSTTALAKFFDRTQEEEAARFVQNVLHSPEDLNSHIKKEAGAVILKIVYGYTVEPHGDDPLVDIASQTMEEFSDATTPGRYAVDIMPMLEYLPDWFPGTDFKKTARKYAARLVQTTEQPYHFVKQQMRQNKAKPSFLSQAIENADPEMEKLNKITAASMYLGGADTTVSSLQTFFLAMMLFPDVQKKAQEELDRVVSGRLPTSADRDNLPYIRALVTETHRWHPVGPMAIPHAATKEDSINGYRIPKGALLIPNNWWFTHDPAVYPEPMNFNPDRFTSKTPQPEPRKFTFGYGRRVCPGAHVADNALFVTIAQVLSVFNISKPVENGKVVEPELRFEPGVVSRPVPYRAAIEPRSEKHRQIIERVDEVYPREKSDKQELENVKWQNS